MERQGPGGAGEVGGEPELEPEHSANRSKNLGPASDGAGAAARPKVEDQRPVDQTVWTRSTETDSSPIDGMPKREEYIAVA